VTGEYKVLKQELVPSISDQASWEVSNVRKGFKGKLIRKADVLARVAKELSKPNGDDVHIVVRNRRCLFGIMLLNSGASE
jgi:hypothetical protein